MVLACMSILQRRQILPRRANMLMNIDNRAGKTGIVYSLNSICLNKTKMMNKKSGGLIKLSRIPFRLMEMPTKTGTIRSI
jgi:hypothetical protein